MLACGKALDALTHLKEMSKKQTFSLMIEIANAVACGDA